VNQETVSLHPRIVVFVFVGVLISHGLSSSLTEQPCAHACTCGRKYAILFWPQGECSRCLASEYQWANFNI